MIPVRDPSAAPTVASSAARPGVDSLFQRLKRTAPAQWLRRMRHSRRFWNSKRVLHFGLYGSFREALEAIPPGMTVGWNHAAAAAMFTESMERVNPRDYPVLFWMRTLWSGPLTVLDYGGHVGGKRYAFEKYLRFDADKRWIVCDVPVVIEQGRRIAAQRRPLNLSFTTDFGDANGCDVLLCLGVLQFVEEPLATQLRRLPRPPHHIIVNGLPLHPHLSYVTLVNNEGSSFSPYRVFQRDAFIEAIQTAGYRLVDHWVNPEKSCWIPMHEHCGVRNYAGLYFRRAD